MISFKQLLIYGLLIVFPNSLLSQTKSPLGSDLDPNNLVIISDLSATERNLNKNCKTSKASSNRSTFIGCRMMRWNKEVRVDVDYDGILFKTIKSVSISLQYEPNTIDTKSYGQTYGLIRRSLSNQKNIPSPEVCLKQIQSSGAIILDPFNKVQPSRIDFDKEYSCETTFGGDRGTTNLKSLITLTRAKTDWEFIGNFIEIRLIVK